MRAQWMSLPVSCISARVSVVQMVLHWRVIFCSPGERRFRILDGEERQADGSHPPLVDLAGSTCARMWVSGCTNCLGAGGGFSSGRPDERGGGRG